MRFIIGTKEKSLSIVFQNQPFNHLYPLFISLDIECPPFNITDIPESRLSHGYKIGTEANFTCPRGFELIGQAKLTCLSNGTIFYPLLVFQH